MKTETVARVNRKPRPAVAVGAGIFLSRVAGFGRDVAIAAFFGTGVAADAYAAALRIPNVIRNLLGEGTLSASFIPVYSGLLGREAAGEARRLAGTVLGLLAVLATALSGLGIVVAPWLTRIIAAGWPAESVELTTGLVRILFPMAGFMILAAWCLGVLNSHRRFFLAFVAPTVWNLAQIAGLMLAWRAGWEPLIVALAWSTLIGGALQFLIQLPAARRLVGGFSLSLNVSWAPVRRVAINFMPVVLGAGVAQISSLLDVFLASFLVHGAVATLYYSQRMYYLPVSLFGISIAASALPELSREADREAHEALRTRLREGFRGTAFTVLPSAFAFILYGDLIVATLFERGDFNELSTLWVHATLSAYAIGMLAASSTKLFASGFHAMLDTRTPVRFAVIALVVGAGVGAILMWPLYAPGLAVGGAVGAWCYLLMLWSGLDRRIGRLFDAGDLTYVVKVVSACLIAAALGLLVEGLLSKKLGATPSLAARAVLTLGTVGVYGVVYLALARVLEVVPGGGLKVWTEAPSSE